MRITQHKEKKNNKKNETHDQKKNTKMFSKPVGVLNNFVSGFSCSEGYLTFAFAFTFYFVELILGMNEKRNFPRIKI